MEPFRYHVYVCQQMKPDGLACCAGRGAGPVIEELRKELAAQGLADAVQVTTSGSIGMCERGPNMIVYPEGVWYSGVQLSDVAEVVREHFGKGIPVERLTNHDPVALKKEIQENRARTLAAMRAAQGG